MNKLNWAALGLVNGESYLLRSRTVVFPFTGAPYDSPFFCFFMTDRTYVISISSPLGRASVRMTRTSQRIILVFQVGLRCRSNPW